MGGLTVAVVPKADGGRLGETIRVRINDALLRRIDQVCQETGRKRSDVMRRLMLEGLERHESGHKSKK